MARKRRRKSQDGQVVKQATLTPAQAYQRWESMHAGDRRRAVNDTLSAISQSTWVYSAVTFIAEHIMRTPLSIYRNGNRIDNHPIKKFLDNPNDYADQDTSSKFRYSYMMELLLHGAVMRVLGGLNGFKPEKMSVRPRWHFRVQWTLDDVGRQIPVGWTLNRMGASMQFSPGDNIFHDALYNPAHDFEGLAPLQAAILSVSNDVSINEFASRFFANDGSTGIIFSTKHPGFGNNQAQEAARAWKEMNSGIENAFTVKFVSFGLEPHNVGTPLDAKMLQILRSFTKEEIVSGIFKVPLDAISAKDGGGDIVIGGPSGGTQASAREAFLINVVQPWAMRYDEDFNRDITWRFDAGIQVLHDFTQNPILERRRLERANAAVQLIDRGVPLNEVIRWLQLDITPQSHGDDWWIKSDMLPARVILDAGDEARRIAIPDPVQSPQAKKAREMFVESILQKALSVAFKEEVRESTVPRDGQTNEDVIRQLGFLGPAAGRRSFGDKPPAAIL